MRVIGISNFENDLCKAINQSFGEEGIAYRRKQAKYTSQEFDILIDHPDKYIAIECKSVNFKKTKKLYFSQHFSDNQIERESEFLNKSGREGYLAIELRRGRGKKKQYIILSWSWVLEKKEKGNGINLFDHTKTDFETFVNHISFNIAYTDQK